MSFPNIRPSARRYTPGDWPVKTFNSINGSELRILRGSNRVNSRLELEFKNIFDSQARLFLQDYYARQGTFKSWNFEPAASRSVFHGWDASGSLAEGDTTVLEAFPYKMQWRYEEEPEIEQVSPGVSTVRVKLIGVITSTMPSIDITPISATTPATSAATSPVGGSTPALDKRILVDAVFLRTSDAVYKDGLAVDGRASLSYFGRPVRGQNKTPGINWATDASWTTAELDAIASWRLYCYRDNLGEAELEPSEGRLLARGDWQFPEGAKLITAPSFGIDPLDRFIADSKTKTDKQYRQTLLEIINIPVDATVTTGVWPRKEKSYPDGAIALPTVTGNDWTGATIRRPDTADSWSDRGYDVASGLDFKTVYPEWTAATGWAGPQARNPKGSTRYFLVVMAINAAGELLSLGSVSFTANNLPPIPWPPLS